jgi:hypothetical protein
MADTPVMYKSDLEDVDTAIYEYIDERFNLFYKEGGVNQTKVPVIYLTNERSFQIKSDLNIRDQDEKLILPIVTINRASVVKDPNRKGGFQAHYYSGDSSGNIGRREIYRRIKQDKTANLSNALSQKRGGTQTVSNNVFNKRATKEVIYEIFTAPIPVYVNIDYKITVMAEYMQEMNSLVQPFMTRTGQINSFVMRRNGHLYEAFIDQNFSQENNVSNLSEEERKFKTEITIKVLAPLVGEGENDNKNLIEKKETISRYYFPSESTIYE